MSGAWMRKILLLAIAVACVSCGPRTSTEVEYMPDMYRQLSVRAQEFDSTAGVTGTRTPPPFTVPRDFEPYPWGIMDTTQAGLMQNPLEPTPDVLEAGRKYFNSYCIVCHGARGDGMGYIIPKFTQPPSLFSEKLVNWPDGRIYHVISMGQGLMNSYAMQLRPSQRWAVIHYVRALQRAAHPTAADLATAEKEGLTLESDQPDTGKATLWPKK